MINYSLVFEVLDRTDAPERPGDHDGQPGTKSFTLLHRVGSEYHAPLVLVRQVEDAVPEEPPGARVHPAGRLVLWVRYTKRPSIPRG